MFYPELLLEARETRYRSSRSAGSVPVSDQAIYAVTGCSPACTLTFKCSGPYLISVTILPQVMLEPRRRSVREVLDLSDHMHCATILGGT